MLASKFHSLLTALVLTPLVTHSVAATSKPNIVFIFADDWAGAIYLATDPHG